MPQSACLLPCKQKFELTSLGSPVGTASSLIALDVEAWRIGMSMLPASPTFSDMVGFLRIILISFVIVKLTVFRRCRCGKLTLLLMWGGPLWRC